MLTTTTNRVHASNAPSLAPLAATIISNSSKSRTKSTQHFRLDPPHNFFFPPSTLHAKSRSSSSPSFTYTLAGRMPPGSDDDTEDEDVIYTARRAPTFRARLFGGRGKVDTISTAPGQLGAGETETELDEPPRHLPTSRLIPVSAPLVPPTTLEQRLTPLFFEFSRLLSIVPATIGTFYNLYIMYYPPTGRRVPERIDFFVSALWAILTGYQCLALTTGLFTRWRVYYPPLATLIRLLALQAICWSATQFTLKFLDHTQRPAATWAAIGTTTCMSRSVQIWVTSNLWWDSREPAPSASSSNLNHVNNSNTLSPGPTPPNSKHAAVKGGWRRFGGRWGGRRWDWREVAVQCMLPAGVLYFIMAWAEQLRREWSESEC